MSENAGDYRRYLESRCRGSVGNRAAVFALGTHRPSGLGTADDRASVAPRPRPSTRPTFSEADFDAAIDDLIRAPWIGEVKAVLSGYFGNAAQAALGCPAGDGFAGAEARSACTVCDPVIGDLGGLYVPQATAEAIGDHRDTARFAANALSVRTRLASLVLRWGTIQRSWTLPYQPWAVPHAGDLGRCP